MAMSSIKKVKVLALLLILLLNLSGCKKETGVIECPFFGTWRIEKVAEISEEYVGMELGGEDLYDAAVFLYTLFSQNVIRSYKLNVTAFTQ